MGSNEDFQVKHEYDDSNFSSSSYYQDFKDEEQSDHSQLNDSMGGVLTTIKMSNGGSFSVDLTIGKRILFCSGKYFYIEYTTDQTEYQKEHTGIVCTCHTCGVKIKGSLKVSSNFISHLKARHQEVYQEFLKQKQETGMGTRIKKSKLYLGGHRVSPYPVNTIPQKNTLQQPEIQQQFHHNIVQFLVATNQSLSLVEDRNFCRLFEYMDYPVQLKTTECYGQMIRDECNYKQIELANYFSNSKVFVCLTSDAWSYGKYKYLALACHWIDEQYQRQTALLACSRSPILRGKCLKSLQNEILMHYNFQNDYVVNTVTENIQNYTTDFVEFGVKKEVLCVDSLDTSEDGALLLHMQDNLKLLNVNNEANINALQLDILKLNKIWGIEFTKHIDETTKVLHDSFLKKCSDIWQVSNTQQFKASFETILNGHLNPPNFFSLTSLYASLKQLLLNKNLLSNVCFFLETPSFSHNELEYLEELVDVFEPLHATFEFLDMPQNNFYGCFLPTLVTLKWKLTRLYNSKKLKYLQNVLVQLKTQLLTEFKSYYELNDTKSEAIIAAITYPPVKTRFLMGLKDSVMCFNFQSRNLLLKYGKDYHINEGNQMDSKMQLNNQQNGLDNVATATDFFDFGDNSEKVDAEELRDVNISKKELNELVAELYDGLMSGGLSMATVDLETPRKFIQSFQDDRLNTPNISPERLENNLDASRTLDFERDQQSQPKHVQNTTHTDNPLPESHNESNIISTNCQNDYSFQPDAMSTPSTHKQNNDVDDYNNMALIPIAQTDNNVQDTENKTITIASSNLNTQPKFIAVPIPGQPNCFQLAKIVENEENTNSSNTNQGSETTEVNKNENTKHDNSKKSRNGRDYISVRRNIIAEYIDNFKNLQHDKISSTTTDSTDIANINSNKGFTQYQFDLMQQQLRIHIQQLTQTYVQTYCHPQLWKFAPKTKELLLDLQSKAKTNANFQVWNLEPAIELMQNWQKELDENTPDNTELMNFLYREHEMTKALGRQIPRFHPRILECYLNSSVFMYPQYLPRMPFSAKGHYVPTFSPVEAYLLAMGLEKHLKLIYDNKEKISYKTTPLRVACKRLCKDTICGKRHKRVWDQIMHLQKVDYYNPVKYFFEHNKAPPVEHDPIWTFPNNIVLPPKDRIPDLPQVFQTYLQKKNEPVETKSSKKSKKSREKSELKVSDAFRNSYLEFVQEALGQDLSEPFYDPQESSDNPHSDHETNALRAEKRKGFLNSKPAAKRRLPQSLTINVNYVYGNGLNISSTSSNSTVTALPALPCVVEYSNQQTPSQNQATHNLLDYPTEEITISNSNTSSNNLPDSTINSTIDLTQDNLNISTAKESPVITYNFDWRTKSLQPEIDTTLLTQTTQKIPSPCPSLPQTNFAENETLATPLENHHEVNLNHMRSNHKLTKKFRFSKKVCHTLRLHKNIKQKASAYREKRNLQKRCEDLITTYSLYLDKILSKHKDKSLIYRFYRRLKALELYSNLLKGLKRICSKNSTTISMSSTSNNSPSSLKRSRNSNSTTEDDSTSPSSARQVKKLNRQEENFRHMLLPETPEEANRKDAIYAFNFYEKVEEAFKDSNKPEDCKKFNAILKSFDPKKDKVSDLYYKLEKLFLPDHPELAQVFLTFLLPSEAAEIGKFFEHFMINNMTTFINKLNIYFNKQPAQIRKIYNCLNDLAEDPELNMKKLESKIIPLLKGNQFLIDWFMQQFPQNTPPERLFSQPEHINLKEQQTNRSGEYVETMNDLMNTPPSSDNQQQQSCQLRYINGRIFYGSKMLLPAKLSFMASSYKHKAPLSEVADKTSLNTCVHGIREHGEKRLQAAAVLASTHTNPPGEPPSSDDQDKSEEEDVSKTLVIDTTADEEDSCSSVELCDESSLRAHAARLNPTVYGSTCYSSANATSTPNLSNNFQAHHPHAKKTSLNFNEENKLSPRKNLSSSHQANMTSPHATSISNSPLNSKEKRRSPNKKTKSPQNNSNRNIKSSTSISVVQPPMVVIHETNSAIQCAKRLKSLIDEEGQQTETAEDFIDSKEIIKIVARTKNSLETVTSQALASDNATAGDEVKEEERSEEMEFLAENPALSPSPFPCLRMETDSNEEDACNITPPPPLATSIPSDEDCKIDLVTSLTTNTESSTSTAKKPAPTSKPNAILPLNSAWTRDEDKVILIEMKFDSQNREELHKRISEKLPNRNMFEIASRHQFLMDFLSKLQGK